MSYSTKYCGKWPPDPRCTIRNAAAAAARIIVGASKGEKVRLPKEQVDARLEICKGNPEKGIPKCRYYVQQAARCQRCGCFMGGLLGKASWSTEKCPAGFW